MSDSADSTASELVIPVYLDTNVLLDLLATVEEGLSLIERVTSGQTSGTSAERSASADFGTPSMFSFFKLGFTGKLGKSSNRSSNETTESERTHTYGSLLHRLRKYLIEENLISIPMTDEAAKVGDFIEFTGIVRPNPFTDSFKKLQRILGFADVAMSMSSTSNPSAQQPKNNRGQNSPRKPSPSSEVAKVNAIQDFIQQLTIDVEREGTSTVVLESQSSGYQAVVTLFDDYLRDRSMSELLNRQFRILGKTARHLPSGSSESVDLLASSGIAGLPSELLGQLTDGVAQMATTSSMHLARPSTSIGAPVVEIVPIAIYL